MLRVATYHAVGVGAVRRQVRGERRRQQRRAVHAARGQVVSTARPAAPAPAALRVPYHHVRGGHFAD